MIYGPTSKKIARKRFMIFFVLLGPESNISKVGQNGAITNGLNLTSKIYGRRYLKNGQCFLRSGQQISFYPFI